jgi:hypothetical protein
MRVNGRVDLWTLYPAFVLKSGLRGFQRNPFLYSAASAYGRIKKSYARLSLRFTQPRDLSSYFHPVPGSGQMESHGGDGCFDFRSGCVKTQSTFTEIGHDAETRANVDASKRLHAVAGLEAAFRNAESRLGFLRG